MLLKPDYQQAIDLLLQRVSAIGTERIPLSQCCGRILAQDLIAQEHVPAFDRSPYDGYALRSVDTISASPDTPVTLQILEEIPAGAVPTKAQLPQTASKILTGAPIPPGADCVIMYENTMFTDTTVTLSAPVKAGENIIFAGEDVKKGSILAPKGSRIDPGLAGTLAAQGESMPLVYRIPKAAILSTGSELIEADESPVPGKIRNSNRYMFETVLQQLGFEAVYLGIAGDSVSEIARLLQQGIDTCDTVIVTGGVSVGDYDLTPAAMESSGIELLFRGLHIKPGMACAYGIKNNKLICGLSGNPASSLINFYIAALPALRKLAGLRDCRLQEFPVTLLDSFEKRSPQTRFLRGHLCLNNGTVSMQIPNSQGNVVLSSTIGCNMMAVIPAGSGPIAAGTVLKGFLL